MTLTTPPALVLYTLSVLTPASAMVLNLTGHLPNQHTGTIAGLAFIPLGFSAFCFETGYMCWPHPWRNWLTTELHEDYHRMKNTQLTRIPILVLETLGVIGVITRLFIHLLATLEANGPRGLEDATINLGLVLNPVEAPRTRVQDMAMRLYTGLLGATILAAFPPSLHSPWWATLIYSANLAVLLIDPLLGLAKPQLTNPGAPT